jgi:hypothetical protein
LPGKDAPTIDLVLPGLLNLPAHELNLDELARSTPILHKLLRFAERVNSSITDFDEILIQRLGLQQRALPYAHAINSKNEGQQLLIKPIHLKADINNAIVIPVTNSDQLDIIINELKEFFKEDCKVELLPDKSWIMTLLNCQPITETPHYLSALGKKVTHYLDQAKTNLPWFKLFNEMQMFLYQHEINQQRQIDGLPMINSLWCWGADHYEGEKLNNTLWFSNDSHVQKIGDLYCGHSAELEDLKKTELKSNAVITDLSILKLLKGHNDLNIQQALESVEQNCLVPVFHNKKNRITVHTAGAFNLHYKSSMAWKFWKKAQLMSDLLEQK